MSKQPFISVVVCSYNGEKVVARAIRSLQAQDYPKSCYEIIVVNDGSKDKTAEQIAQFKTITSVQLVVNQGLSEARNAGLAAAKGDVVACFDDDCIAAPDWLSELAKGYDKPDVAGVGGSLVVSEVGHSVSAQYIALSSSALPAVLGKEVQKKNCFQRLLSYLVGHLRDSAVTSTEPVIEVVELYGANSSFPVSILREVGGWHKSASGIEDRDICRRIHERYPNKHFYVVSSAKITHDDHMTLWQYLMRPYRRGPVNARFHYQNRIIPPLFPFPFLIATIAVAFAVEDHIKLAPLALVILPQLAYFWWAYHAYRRSQPAAILFPYLQLAEETMVLVGLARGYVIIHRRGKHA